MEKNNLLRSSAGFTLVEAIVVALLVAVFALMAVTGMTYLGQAQATFTRSVELEENSRLLAATVPRYLGQAVNTVWDTGPIGDIGAGQGRLQLAFDSGLDMLATPPASLGVFLRESGHPAAGNPGSDLRATALYFRNPTPLSEGELIVSSSGPGGGALTLSPDDPGVLKFGSIVELHQSPAGMSAKSGDSVRVIRLRIVYRKFTDPERSNWRWCPAADMAQPKCASVAQYRDVTRTLDIPLVDNAVATNTFYEDGTRRKETLFGDLYFFGMSSP